MIYNNGGSTQHRFGSGGVTPAVKRIVKITVIVSLVQWVLETSGQPVLQYFALVPAFVFAKFMPWQLVSYMFLHGGLTHLAINMFILWMFGAEVERIWGSGRFLFYYFFTGIGAGICTYLSSAQSLIPTIGASGAVFGVLLAYGMMFPNRTVLLWFLFPMKARTMVILFGVMEFLASVGHVQDGIGHFAHLGGMLFGYIYLKNQGFFTNLMPKVKFVDDKGNEETGFEDADFFEGEIDPILDKISRYGMESLSEKELDKLRKAKHRMIH
ncbi:MAG: rhomboid family intramembrane serine protease [bacterium]